MLGGDRAPIHIKEMLAAVSQAVPSAEHVVLRGQGHAAHVTAPEQVARAIEAFTDNVPRQRGIAGEAMQPSVADQPKLLSRISQS